MIKERILIIGSTSGLAIELIKRLKVKFKIYKISRKEVNALKNYESYGNYIKKIRPKIVINCIVASGIDFCEEIISGIFKYFCTNFFIKHLFKI